MTLIQFTIYIMKGPKDDNDSVISKNSKRICGPAIEMCSSDDSQAKVKKEAVEAEEAVKAGKVGKEKDTERTCAGIEI